MGRVNRQLPELLVVEEYDCGVVSADAPALSYGMGDAAMSFPEALRARGTDRAPRGPFLPGCHRSSFSNLGVGDTSHSWAAFDVTEATRLTPRHSPYRPFPLPQLPPHRTWVGWVKAYRRPGQWRRGRALGSIRGARSSGQRDPNLMSGSKLIRVSPYLRLTVYEYGVRACGPAPISRM